MYDLLIVGAGITAATLVARLRDHGGVMRICVIDTRPHLGGNCFDHADKGSFIHGYGPHIFHSPSPRITGFLSRFTQWTPYTHKVLAEIQDPSRPHLSPCHPATLSPCHNLRYVPFPYSRQTARILGRHLDDDEILDAFFRGYSQKMWGMPWEELPSSVRGRIPRQPHELSDEPAYYRDDFVALPKLGYTHMLENMLDGAELILSAPPLEWTRIRAATIIYTGRPDLIPLPGQSTPIAAQQNLQLDFRTLDIQFSGEAPPGPWAASDAACLHACSAARPWTRKTSFARMTGGATPLLSTETPRAAAADELTPYYPIEIDANHHRHARLAAAIRDAWPNLHLAGRLGSYRYFDMYQAVGNALSLADKLFAPIHTRPQPIPA